MDAADSLPRRILIADDDGDVQSAVSDLLEREGFGLLEAQGGESVLDVVGRERPDVVLLDATVHGKGSAEILEEIKEAAPDTCVILMTSFASTDWAVEALKRGAYACVPKPLETGKLVFTLRKALDSMQPAQEGRRSGDGAKRPSCLGELMGSSEQIRRAIADTELVAPTDFTVLISGETGSGKELVARAIHGLSNRAQGPFVPVDCGSIPSTLIESELFGHEKGSFTGAANARMGKFELASQGTLFLDEVGNLSRSVQPKLLRALQERRIWRVGGTKGLDVDIRVLAATNQDIVAMVQTGRFRRDLYYRLNEFSIRVPPLRERRQDTVYLAERFLRLTNEELQSTTSGFTDTALHVLLSYGWPGNVRELRNVVRRAVLLADAQIGPEHLSILDGSYMAIHEQTSLEKEFDGSVPFKEIVRRKVVEVERGILRQVLRETSGNKAKAARVLKLDYKPIQKKVKEYGIAT